MSVRRFKLKNSRQRMDILWVAGQNDGEIVSRDPDVIIRIPGDDWEKFNEHFQRIHGGPVPEYEDAVMNIQPAA